MSLRRHQEGMIRGDVVGDIDTEKIIAQGVVGCDCSGCVSAWLGIPRLTTAGIESDLEGLFEKISINELRPGDLLNRGGSHVRMLLNKIEDPNGTNYRVIESAKSCGGVCIKVYTAAQLGRYTPLTYKYFID